MKRVEYEIDKLLDEVIINVMLPEMKIELKEPVTIRCTDEVFGNCSVFSVKLIVVKDDSINLYNPDGRRITGIFVNGLKVKDALKLIELERQGGVVSMIVDRLDYVKNIALVLRKEA